MTIDEAVQKKVESVLETQEYCTRLQITEIAQKACEKVKKDYEHDLETVSKDCERLLTMNDRLWDSIHKLSEPKFPKFRHFLSFRWAKFWRNWNLKWRFWKSNENG